MARLPTGIVTFLMTDVERSTELWEHHPDAMGEALATHDALCGRIVTEFNGQVVKARGEGDSLFCVFELARDALAAAWRLKHALEQQEWPTSTPIRIRIALHSGEPESRGGDYYGSAVNRCARMRAAGHGGQVLVSEATSLLAGAYVPQGAGLHDLGSHRLKDLLRPERIFELVDTATAHEFPPLRTLTELPHNLPLQLTSFIGREGEIAQIIDLLAANRLVTIAGPGGSGKTRVALHVAAEVVDRYADGVWLVELAPLQSPELVAQSVAGVLNISLAPNAPVEAQLTESLSRRNLLLVLDNCEHLIGECTRLAKLILGSAPDVKIMATSRQPLSLSGEQSFRLGEMQLPSEESTTVAKAMQSEAVSLFVERAVSHNRSFYVSEKNVAAVIDVCRHLDGMPLAIELAASKLRVLSPEALVERLSDRFGLLSSPDRTEVDRQRTLRRTIEWSYELLSHDERELFLRLSVFRGSWNLEAAEAVCAGGHLSKGSILDLLEQLLDKSLVTFDDASGEGRFRMLETLREFVVSVVPDETADKTRRQFLDWCLGLVQRAEPMLVGPEQDVWLEKLERELDNVRSALDWGLEQENEDLQNALLLTASLSRFFLVRNLVKEGRAWLDRAIAASISAPLELRARLINSAGIMAMRDGATAAAKQLLLSAAERWEQTDDKKGLASTLNNLGLVSRDLREDEDAARYFDRSYHLFRDAGLDSQAAIALTNLALAARDRRDLDLASRLFGESLAMHEEAGDLWSVALCKGGLGEVAMEAGDRDEAVRWMKEALTLSLDLKDIRNVGLTLCTLGAIAVDAEDYERAARLFAAGQRAVAETATAVSSADNAIFEAQERRLLTDLWDKAIEEAWRKGASMKLDRVVHYALHD